MIGYRRRILVPSENTAVLKGLRGEAGTRSGIGLRGVMQAERRENENVTMRYRVHQASGSRQDVATRGLMITEQTKLRSAL